MKQLLKYNLGDRVVVCCDDKTMDLHNHNGEVGMIVQIDVVDRVLPYAVMFLPVDDIFLSKKADREVFIEGKSWMSWLRDVVGDECLYDHWCWAPEFYLLPTEIEEAVTTELDLSILF